MMSPSPRSVANCGWAETVCVFGRAEGAAAVAGVGTSTSTVKSANMSCSDDMAAAPGGRRRSSTGKVAHPTPVTRTDLQPQPPLYTTSPSACQTKSLSRPIAWRNDWRRVSDTHSALSVGLDFSGWAHRVVCSRGVFAAHTRAHRQAFVLVSASRAVVPCRLVRDRLDEDERRCIQGVREEGPGAVHGVVALTWRVAEVSRSCAEAADRHGART